MKLSQPVFYTASVSRSQNFAAETYIYKSGSTLYAVKKALHKEAVPHLEKMFSTYKLLSKYAKVQEMVTIAEPQKTRDGIRFDYIHGESAERYLIEAVLEPNAGKVKEYVDYLISVVNSLPNIRTNPAQNKDYVNVFGNTFSETAECLTIGLIDLNLDNFIVDKNKKWHLFDYEWAFDFPVPKHLVIQRFFWWFIIRYQESFRYHFDKIECVSLRSNLYVPNVMFDLYKKYFENMDELLEAEKYFQSYVSGQSPTANIKPGLEFYKDALNEQTPFVGLDRILRHEKRASDLKKHAQKLELKNARLENELRRIHRSRSYRALRKVSRARKKLKREK